MRHRLVALSCVLLLGGGVAAAIPASDAQAGSGSSWTVDPITLAMGDTTELAALDCADSAADGTCFAVGSTTDASGSHHVLAERRGASGWTDVPAVDPTKASDAELTSIGCASLTLCFAVGRAAFGRTARTVIERSYAGGWRLQSHPNPTGAVSELSGVSCVSATFCVAVGDAGTSTTRSALIETWDGAAWHIVDAPDPALPSTQLLDVDCTSPAFCVAVGAAGPSATTRTTTVLEVWNGSTWTVHTAQTGDAADLTAVDCTSSTFCLAVGDVSTYKGDSLLGERWNGTSWITANPAPPAGFDPSLRGISCVSPSYCLAVGTNDLDPGAGAFALRWNGSGFVSKAKPRPTLLAVRCFSAAHCEGVGSYGEYFDGVHWELEASPYHVGSPTPTRLRAVSCATPTSCLAVGENSASGAGYPLALQGASASWHSVRDLPAAETSSINAVSCGRATAPRCLSSGYYEPGLNEKTIVQSFSDGEWSVMQGVPEIGGSDAISCTSSFCVVTGVRAVAMFDGTSWTSTRITGPHGKEVDLAGVDCVSADDCVLVGGYYGSYPRVESALIERWDGSRWRPVPAPLGPSARFNSLRAVQCASSSSCVAVGTSHGDSDTSLVFKWDGSTWTSVAHPSTGAGLAGVACASAGSCVAVGPKGSAIASTDGTWTRSRIAVPPGDTGALPDLTGITFAGHRYHAVGFYDRLGDQTIVAETLRG